MLMIHWLACMVGSESPVDSSPASFVLEDCVNGLDDDGDGLLDCQDEDCLPSADCLEDCFNGIDDDGDGKADCRDLDCIPNEICPEVCYNLVDDDDDGLADCSDPDCIPYHECPEDCVNSADDDDDGLVDCRDPDCSSLSECDEECDDGVDNNRDGETDCDDARCIASWACGETQLGACIDGVDNDGDGLVDCEDGGCFRVCQESACGNGLDDDADGYTDCADVDCWKWTACPDSVALFWSGTDLEWLSDSGKGGWSGSTSGQSGYSSFYFHRWNALSPTGTAWFTLNGEAGSCKWSATRFGARLSYFNSDGRIQELQSFHLQSFESTGACIGLVSESMFEFQIESLLPARIGNESLSLDGDPFGANRWNDRRPWVQQR